MTAFPLLKLPLIPLKSIIRQLDPPDVVELVMMSEKFKQRITNIKLKVEKFELRDSSIYFQLQSNESSSYSKMLIRKLDGCLVGILKNSIPLVVSFSIINEMSSMQSVEKITKYFLSFLKVDHFQVQFRAFMRTPRVNFKELFIWNITKSFHRVCITEHGQSVEVTKEELRFLLEDITTNVLELKVALKKGARYTYPKPLSISTVLLYENNWLDLTNLSNWKCENIQIHIQHDSKLILNDFLKNWIQGKNDELEHFKAITKSSNAFKFNQVLEGIETIPTVFSRHLMNRGCNPYFRNKVDIKRANDNRVATIILRNVSFDMIVWKDKHLTNLNAQFNPFG